MRSLTALAVLLLAGLSHAAVVRLLSHEGRLLRVNGTAEQGTVQMTFALYAAASGGAASWTETQAVALSGAGYYSVQLGKTTPLPAVDGPLWLGITLQGESEMTPRAQLTSAAFALRAALSEDALALGGSPAASYLRTDAYKGVALDYEFEETSGTSFADSSGLGSTANAPVGGVTAGTFGHTGKSATFTGGVLYVAPSANRMPDSPQISVEAWVEPAAPLNVTRTVVYRVNSYILRQVNQNLSFQVSGAGGGTCTVSSADSPIVAGAWTHLSAWYDGLVAGVAVNGMVRATVSCTVGGVAPSGSNFHVGGILNGDNTVSEPYAGKLDELRIRATATPRRPGAVYTQWGVSGCTGGAQTLVLGYGMTVHYTHPDNGEPLCLKRSAAAGPPGAYAGDILYAASINGGSVHQGVIQDNKRLACSRCATTRTSCFRMEGDHACPAGFTAQYTGYLYGGHYTHTGRMSAICVDHNNYDNSLPNSPDTGGYLYPTYTNDPGTTGITGGTYVKCAMCCAD